MEQHIKVGMRVRVVPEDLPEEFANLANQQAIVVDSGRYGDLSWLIRVSSTGNYVRVPKVFVELGDLPVEDEEFNDLLSHGLCNFIGLDLRMVTLDYRELDSVAFYECRISTIRHLGAKYVSFQHCEFGDLAFEDVPAHGIVDMSGCKGVPNGIDFLAENFEFVPEGMIAYKTFEQNYSPNKNWKIKPGSVLNEVVDDNPRRSCGYGINVATLEWVNGNCDNEREIWKVLIRNEWLPGVVVPFYTDGKIRATRVELLETIGTISEDDDDDYLDIDLDVEDDDEDDFDDDDEEEVDL